MDDEREAGALLSVRLGRGLKARWEAHCAGQGVKPSTAVKAAIEAAVSRPEAAPERVLTVERGAADRGEKVRLTVRLTPSEIAGVKEHAAALEISVSRWLVRLVRAALTREPEFGAEEVRALWESSRQLGAIGRNLNQVARHLNETGELDDDLVAVIETLRTEIRSHLREVSAVVAGGQERWTIG